MAKGGSLTVTAQALSDFLARQIYFVLRRQPSPTSQPECSTSPKFEKGKHETPVNKLEGESQGSSSQFLPHHKQVGALEQEKWPQSTKQGATEGLSGPRYSKKGKN